MPGSPGRAASAGPAAVRWPTSSAARWPVTEVTAAGPVSSAAAAVSAVWAAPRRPMARVRVGAAPVGRAVRPRSWPTVVPVDSAATQTPARPTVAMAETPRPARAARAVWAVPWRPVVPVVSAAAAASTPTVPLVQSVPAGPARPAGQAEPCSAEAATAVTAATQARPAPTPLTSTGSSAPAVPVERAARSSAAPVPPVPRVQPSRCPAFTSAASLAVRARPVPAPATPVTSMSPTFSGRSR